MDRFDRPVLCSDWFAGNNQRMPRTASKSSGKSESATRLKSILKGKEWDAARLIQELVKLGDEYKTAHALVWRILNGRAGELQEKSKAKLEKALGIPDGTILSPSHEKNLDDARVAVVTSLIEAPRSTDDEIMSDLKVLLKDPVTAPYLKMATKILKHLS